jgi:hypothetical protein
MSNTWAYEVLLPRHVGIEEIDLACLVAEERGYSPLTPEGRIARVVTLDGMDAHEYARPEEAIAWLVANGGGLQLWKADIDIQLTLHPGCGSRVDGSFDPTPEGWSRLTLSVDGSFFRDEPVRSTVAGDMAQVFAGLCERLNAAYGFSRDEEAAEAFRDETRRIPSSVVTGGKPPLLFWMNYFRRECFPWLDEAAFSRVGGWVTTFPRGVLVSLFDVPWEVELGRLREVNRRWIA